MSADDSKKSASIPKIRVIVLLKNWCCADTGFWYIIFAPLKKGQEDIVSETGFISHVTNLTQSRPCREAAIIKEDFNEFEGSGILLCEL